MRRYRYYMQAPKQVYNLAKFISEVALVFYPLAHYKPSIVAAVSLHLASVAHTLSIVSTVYSNCLRLDEREVVSVACKFVPFVLEMAAPNGKYHALYDNFKKVAGLPLSNDQINRLKLLLD
uniref:Cyclin C-terminal domain-containing protein n=1 Tax=Ditylenchus dipsaci TaxID=166011 RepID=A0A915DCD7_9BILA